MNICMFSPFSLSMASSTHRLVCFGEELVKQGHNVSVILPRFDRHTSFSSHRTLEYLGIKIIQPFQPPSTSIFLSNFSYLVSSFLKAVPEKTDVIHVLKPLPINFSPFLLKSLKHIPLLQDMDDLDHTVMAVENHSPINVKLVEATETILPTFADHITTCSSSLKQIYINMGVNPKKITWLPNGVKTSDFNATPPVNLKEKLGLKQKVIVYLGSLNNPYQVTPLINAMAFVVTKRKDTSCLIIGDGTAKPYLKQLTKRLQLNEYIRFVGRIPYNQVPKYLSIADIGFASCPPPLTSTGGALKVFMYMAAGLPVVLDKIGDLPYYIDYGKAGVISELDSFKLSNSLIDLVNDDQLRQRKGAYAKSFVRSNFDWDVLTAKLTKIYDQLVS